EDVAANGSVTDSFTYTITDGHGDTDTKTVSVTVNVPAEAVTAADKTEATDEDVVLSKTAGTGLLLGATHDSDDPIHVSLVNGAATIGAPITLASGATLTVNANGSYSYDASTYTGIED